MAAKELNYNDHYYPSTKLPKFDVRLQRRGFDITKFDEERDWQPDPDKPDEVHPAVAREQARQEALSVAEKRLGKEVKVVPVGLAARAIEAMTETIGESETYVPHADVVSLQDYAADRSVASAA